ncbi:MAG TPA: OmpA family protein [Steroidobacteraceae bacterium]|nr:OmpA family protein [Steroidobacteraceae bacterium]
MMDERFWIWLSRVEPLLITLALVAIALVLLHGPIQSAAQRKVEQATFVDPDEGKARDHVSDALTRLLLAKHVPEQEAADLARSAGERLMDNIKKDSTGEMARAFGDWIRGAKPEDAVLPYLRQAIGDVAHLEADDLKSIRDGFFGGLGGLPWDVVKDLISGSVDSLFAKDQKFEVKCACCDGKGADGATQPTRCPEQKPPPTCPADSGATASCEREKFEIPFKPEEHALNRAEQTARVDQASAAALKAGNAEVIVWARTDTTASDMHNVSLARQRGEAVRAALGHRGVPIDRIRIAPLGEYALIEPTADNRPNDTNRTLTIEVSVQRTVPVPTR